MSKISVVQRRGEKLAPNFGVPFYCPRCEELRNIDPETEATGLNTPPEALMFQSFQMCSKCYTISKNQPEVVENNKKLYLERLREKEKQIAEKVSSKRFRIWIKGDYAKYVESIVGKPFFGWEDRRGSRKCKSLVGYDEAEKMRDSITSKGIECWIEEEPEP